MVVLGTIRTVMKMVAFGIIRIVMKMVNVNIIPTTATMVIINRGGRGDYADMDVLVNKMNVHILTQQFRNSVGMGMVVEISSHVCFFIQKTKSAGGDPA